MIWRKVNKIFDWQVRMFLFDECWSFFGVSNIDEIKRLIIDACFPGNGLDTKSTVGLLIHLTDDVLTVRTTFARMLNMFLRNSYYFTGRLERQTNGFVGLTLQCPMITRKPS